MSGRSPFAATTESRRCPHYPYPCPPDEEAACVAYEHGSASIDLRAITTAYARAVVLAILDRITELETALHETAAKFTLAEEELNLREKEDARMAELQADYVEQLETLDAERYEAQMRLAQVLGWGNFRECSAAQTEQFAEWAKEVGLSHLGNPPIRQELFGHAKEGDSCAKG